MSQSPWVPTMHLSYSGLQHSRHSGGRLSMSPTLNSRARANACQPAQSCYQALLIHPGYSFRTDFVDAKAIDVGPVGTDPGSHLSSANAVAPAFGGMHQPQEAAARPLPAHMDRPSRVRRFLIANRCSSRYCFAASSDGRDVAAPSEAHIHGVTRLKL